MALIIICMLASALLFAVCAKETRMFSPLPNPGGDPCVRSIITLSDGRRAFATKRGVDIFNGFGFNNLAGATGNAIPLPSYKGYYHLYLSHGDRFLWIKNRNSLKCIDLDTELYSTDVAEILKSLGSDTDPDDFFADGKGRIWSLKRNRLLQPELGLNITIESEDGPLLDLVADDSNVYLFYGNGKTVCHELSSGKPLYSGHAFPQDDVWKFSQTSLVVENGDFLYQIRNGALGGLFRFDKISRKWDKLLETDIRLNTLAIADSIALISTNKGLLEVNTDNSRASHIPYLKTRSGNMLASEISTIRVDNDGSVWLGLLDRGILRYHPLEFNHISIPKTHPDSDTPASPASVFSENNDGTVSISGKDISYVVSPHTGSIESIPAIATKAKSATGEYGNASSFVSGNGSLFFNEPGSFEIFIRNASISIDEKGTPFIAGLLVNGERIKPLGTYGGNVILNRVPSRQEGIILEHDQNFLTFEASSPQSFGDNITYHYMLEGIDRDWNVAKTDNSGHSLLKATYTAIPPGEYRFRVKNTSGNSPEASLKITVKAPWWATGFAFALYLVFAVALIITGLRIYTKRTERRIAAEQREQNLLERIRHLIEEVDRYKTESPTPIPTTTEPSDCKGSEVNDGSGQPSSLSEADHRFIAKAVEMVEKNLDTPGYSVEQLSKDLCMERTGLYRKLTTMLDQSPSLFIRDIRLRNAARLLKEGTLSVTEIAEASGFSSTSYMSKCFQERYGCRPSEYIGK